MATSHPRLASIRATASPMPPLPPTTSAPPTRPAKSLVVMTPPNQALGRGEVPDVQTGRPVGQDVLLDTGLHETVVVDGADPHEVVARLDVAFPDHCTQLSSLGTAPSSAGCQSPPSMLNSTAEIPVCCDHATPPKRTAPAATSSPDRGTSTRDDIFTGPSSPQPRSVQYDVMSANVETSISTTHFVAET